MTKYRYLTTTKTTKIARTIDEFRSIRRDLAVGDQSVGFVPTMGALHDGHLSLLRGAREQNNVLIASVFINSKQFGPNEDFEKYPRNLEKDTELLAEAGADLIFAPSTEIMYPKDFCTFVRAEGFDHTEEEKCRPGFFRGVATVVTKLLNIVRPTRAYFGQKDAVQCSVIRRIVEDLSIPTEVVVMPTVRESDGLAMSSRNAYLTPEEREVAGIVYASLNAGRDVWRQHVLDETVSDPLPAAVVRDAVVETLRTEKMVREIEYVSIDSWRNMRSVETMPRAESFVVSLAVRVGSVRLIDNVLLEG